MNRKEFLKQACQLGIGCGPLILVSGSVSPGAASTAQEEASPERRDRFTRGWIKTLMEDMDAQLDEKTRVGLMEASGRACARNGAINAAKACNGDLNQLLQTLKKWLGDDNVRREGNVVYQVYSKCLCPMVQSGTDKLSDTYCNCSRGWVMEMYETVLRKPVKVELTESIKRGGKTCRFTIQV